MRTEGKSPCERKIEIFDEQPPFDLKLYFRRQQQIGKGEATTFPSLAFRFKINFGRRAPWAVCPKSD